MKKLLVLILTVSLMLPALAACSRTGTDTVDTTDGGEQETLPVVLADSDRSYYTLIRPDNTTNTVVDYYVELLKSMSALYGLKPATGNDWIKPGYDPSADLEILIGYTNREETKTVMDSIAIDGCAVKRVNNKIVIAAHTPKKLSHAIQYFLNNMLSVTTDEQGVKSLVFTGEFVDPGTNAFFFSKENPLENYKIVCAAADTDAAKIIQNALNEEFGFSPELVYDTVPEGENEIIVGNANRAVCRELLTGASAPADDTYIINASGTTLLVGAAKSHVTKLAAIAFASDFINGMYSDRPTVTGDAVNQLTVYNFADPVDRAQGTDIRVMSYNILAELWDPAASVIDGRDLTTLSLITMYSPDVVGLQEVTDKWHTRLNTLFGDDYKIINKTNSAGLTNFSTIAYNTRTVKLIADGTEIFSKGNSAHMRLATWGLFEKLETGERFIVINTHWDIVTASNPNGLANRMTESTEMANLALRLKAEYSCPIVSTGDYNCRESSEEYRNFKTITGFDDAKYSAAVINRACGTSHLLGTQLTVVNGAESIDHILSSTDLEILYYNTLIDYSIALASDHCPIYADFSFR